MRKKKDCNCPVEIDPGVLVEYKDYSGNGRNAFVLLTHHTRVYQILSLWKAIRNLPAINPIGNKRLSLDYCIVNGLRLLYKEIEEAGNGKVVPPTRTEGDNEDKMCTT